MDTMLKQFNQELHHHVGCVELPPLFAGVIGELLNEVLVGASEHVRFGEFRVT